MDNENIPYNVTVTAGLSHLSWGLYRLIHKLLCFGLSECLKRMSLERDQTSTSDSYLLRCKVLFLDGNLRWRCYQLLLTY